MQFGIDDVDKEDIEKPKATILFDKKTPKESLTDEKKFRITKGTVEDISRLLNFDYIEYNGIKPFIQDKRAIEVESAHRALQLSQRELDIINTSNTQLEREYSKLIDAVNTFESINEAAIETNTSSQHFQERLEAEVVHIHDLLEQEKRRIFGLEHMKIRTRDDIVGIKTIHSDLLANIDKNKSELAILTATLRSMTLDVKMQERQFEEVMLEIESRQAQRDEQLQSIKYMVNEGKRSIQAIKDMSPASTHQLDPIVVPHEPSHPKGTLNSFQSRTSTARSMRTRSHNKSNPNHKQSFKSLSLVKSDHMKSELSIADDISSSLLTLEAQNIFLDTKLAEAEAWRVLLELRRKQLEERKLEVQNRRQFEGQLLRYDEEIDRLNGELHSITMRDVRLKEGLDSLCQAVPRFLTKLTHKTCQPSESIEEVSILIYIPIVVVCLFIHTYALYLLLYLWLFVQLEESIEALEIELSKTLLTLNTSLVSCSAITEGDEDDDDDDDCFSNRKPQSSSISNSTSSRGMSEMAKLHQYIHSQQGIELQSRLFKALMSALPNDTARNVRIHGNGRLSTRKKDPNASATASTFKFKSQSALGSQSKISSYRRFSRGSLSTLAGATERDSDDEDDDVDDSNTKRMNGMDNNYNNDTMMDTLDRKPALITTKLTFDRSTMKAISNLIVTQNMKPKRTTKVARNLSLKRGGQRGINYNSNTTNNDSTVQSTMDIIESTNNIRNEV